MSQQERCTSERSVKTAWKEHASIPIRCFVTTLRHNAAALHTFMRDSGVLRHDVATQHSSIIHRQANSGSVLQLPASCRIPLPPATNRLQTTTESIASRSIHHLVLTVHLDPLARGWIRWREAGRWGARSRAAVDAVRRCTTQAASLGITVRCHGMPRDAAGCSGM